MADVNNGAPPVKYIPKMADYRVDFVHVLEAIGRNKVDEGDYPRLYSILFVGWYDASYGNKDVVRTAMVDKDLASAGLLKLAYVGTISIAGITIEQTRLNFRVDLAKVCRQAFDLGSADVPDIMIPQWLPQAFRTSPHTINVANALLYRHVNSLFDGLTSAHGILTQRLAFARGFKQNMADVGSRHSTCYKDLPNAVLVDLEKAMGLLTVLKSQYPCWAYLGLLPAPPHEWCALGYLTVLQYFGMAVISTIRPSLMDAATVNRRCDPDLRMELRSAIWHSVQDPMNTPAPLRIR